MIPIVISRGCRAALAAAFLMASPALTPRVAAATPPDSEIRGRIVDEAGDPAADVAVSLFGTRLGALSDDDGQYRIRAVPPGVYRIEARKFGFSPVWREGVVVTSGQVVSQDLALRALWVVELEPIEVNAELSERMIRARPDVRVGYRRGEIASAPIESPLEALSLKSGFVVQAGKLHVGGARSNSTQIEIDGIRVSDPLGGSLVEVATSAVADADAIIGGYDAEYGNAQSGVILLTTQEGGPVFAGDLKFETDDFGGPDKTYNNYDRVELGVGGPTGVRGVRWFASAQGTFEDTALKTAEERPRRTLLDFVRVGPRQRNELKLQGKLSWRPRPPSVLTLEFLANRSRQDVYSHLFSRRGFVQVRLDTLATSGQVLTRYGRFAAEPEDSSWVPYNAAAHTPDDRGRFDQVKLAWNEVLGPATFTSFRFSRHAFAFDSRLRGAEPWEYTTRYPDQWRDQIGGTTSPYFATNGDYPAFTRRRTVTWTVKGDVTHTVGRHRFKAGAEGVYNDLSTLGIEFPQALSLDGRIGATRNEFRYFNSEGACYVQDQWEHEGMVLNAGARLDLFSVGDQLDASEVKGRWRHQVSPRIGMAYPVTDRDVFAFHYGLFAQPPDRAALYENRSGSSRIQGNPDLETEATVAYQASVQHMFSADVSGQFSVYFKDIFGLLSTERVDPGNRGGLVDRWVNGDYASARGFDVTVRKRFTRGFSGELSYGYASATGVASDPDQQAATALLYLPISEQPLDWDQRHTLSAQAHLSRPDDWTLNVVWTWGSGFPYTPRARNERRLAPALINSGRLPSTTSLNFQAEKHFLFWGQDLKLYFRGNNVLDATNIFDLSPTNWPPPPGFDADDYAIYYTETGRAGGAFLGEDSDGDGLGEWVPVNDPRVYQPRRTLRMGVGLQF